MKSKTVSTIENEGFIGSCSFSYRNWNFFIHKLQKFDTEIEVFHTEIGTFHTEIVFCCTEI